MAKTQNISNHIQNLTTELTKRTAEIGVMAYSEDFTQEYSKFNNILNTIEYELIFGSFDEETIRSCKKEIDCLHKGITETKEISSAFLVHTLKLKGLIYYHFKDFNGSIVAFDKVISKLQLPVKRNLDIVSGYTVNIEEIFKSHAYALQNKANALCKLKKHNYIEDAIECYIKAIISYHILNGIQYTEALEYFKSDELKIYQKGFLFKQDITFNQNILELLAGLTKLWNISTSSQINDKDLPKDNVRAVNEDCTVLSNNVMLRLKEIDQTNIRLENEIKELTKRTTELEQAINQQFKSLQNLQNMQSIHGDIILGISNKNKPDKDTSLPNQNDLIILFDKDYENETLLRQEDNLNKKNFCKKLREYCKKCEVFLAHGILYDNPLLNNIQICEMSLKTFNLNEILSISQNISISLMHEIIYNHNQELLLAALISLDDSF